jgi:hypothetical protein
MILRKRKYIWVHTNKNSTTPLSTPRTHLRKHDEDFKGLGEMAPVDLAVPAAKSEVLSVAKRFRSAVYLFIEGMREGGSEWKSEKRTKLVVKG